MSNLDRDLAEMKRLGYTSYGKYKLDYPNTKVEKPGLRKKTKTPPPAEHRKKCACCGNSFIAKYAHKMYCSDACYRKASQRKYRERRAGQRVQTVAKCGICGAEFVQVRSTHKYCSQACHAEGVRRNSKLWRQRLKEAENGVSV